MKRFFAQILNAPAMTASLLAVGLFAQVAFAAPSTLPVLAKRIEERNFDGKVVGSLECLIHSDGVVISRVIDGISLTEEKSVSLATNIDARIVEVTKTAPILSASTVAAELTYSFEAYRTSSAGIRETVILQKLDANGLSTSNLSKDALVLQKLINSVCPSR